MADKSNPVGWFEIPVLDVARARGFYEHLLGVTMEVQDMGAYTMAFFPMADGVYGSAGTLAKGPGHTPSQEGTLVYFSVDDIEGTLRRAAEKGGVVLEPKKSIGEYGFIGLLRDTEGNRVALHSMK